MAQAAGKYGEHAPMAAVCCNACRTCVTTNVLTLLTGAAVVAFVTVPEIDPPSGSAKLMLSVALGAVTTTGVPLVTVQFPLWHSMLSYNSPNRKDPDGGWALTKYDPEDRGSERYMPCESVDVESTKPPVLE